MGAGGVFAAPSTPHEPNVGLVIYYFAAFGDLVWGCKRKYATTLRGADESLCGMLTFSTNIDGAAALCRPDMPHTLRSPPGGVEPPLRRLLWRRRDSSTLPAHGRYRPVTPILLLFREKK